ncbi:MAG: HAD family hydrolase [Spirochaetota bacterium]
MNRVWNSKYVEQILEPNDWGRLQEQVRSRAADLRPLPTEMKSRFLPLDDVRAVLFDIYGTLLISDAGEILTGSEQQDDSRSRDLDAQALQSLPKLLRSSLKEDFRPSLALKKAIVAQHKRMKKRGIPYPEVDVISLWHRIFLQQLNEDMYRSLNPFILARFALEYELLHNRVQLMPGTLELLHWLSVRNFYVGIISNAQFYTPIIFSALLGLRSLSDLNILSDLCFWSYQYSYGKPEPEFFNNVRGALGRYGLEPHEALYLGNDMRNDVWGAHQAGFATALFAGDRRSLRLHEDMAELASLEADLIVTELGQLKSVL